MKTILSIALLALATSVGAQYMPMPNPNMNYTPQGAMQQMPMYRQAPMRQQTYTHRQTPVPGAAETLQKGLTELTDFLSQEPPPKAQAVAEFLEQHVSQYFDFSYMSRRAAGGWFNRLAPQQQSMMTAEMRAMFMGAMANRLMGYGDQEVRLMRPRYSNAYSVNMPIMILGKDKYPTRIDFSMRYHNGKWRVYDIAANGQSAIVHYRQVLMNKFRQ